MTSFQFMTVLMTLLSLGLGSGALAADLASDSNTHNHKHLPSAAERALVRQWNHRIQPFAAQVEGWSAARPFSEIEATGFVAISGDTEYELGSLREAIAQNLPTDVTLVVYVSQASEIAGLQSTLGKWLDSGHLKFLVTPVATENGDPIWGRDSLPFPVYLPTGTQTAPAFGLVASLYPQHFDPNAIIDKALALPMVSTNTYFRGGNLLFDLKGNCFAENANEVAEMNDPKGFFQHYFGCSTVTILDQEGGIGDIDERLKFLSGNQALTDDKSYADLLTSKGYDVQMIPTTGADYETYMNTLVVNGTIFVPQMGIPADKDALAAYTKLGFKPVGVMTKQLADEDNGNIHCLTMNYPPGAFVTSSRGPAFVEFATSSQQP